MKCVLLGTCLLLSLGSARADILPEGSVGVSHTFEVEGLEKAPPGTRFFVYPTHLDAPPRQVKPGEPFSFYKLHDPRLYAVTGDNPPEEMNREFFADESVPRSDIQFDMVSSVSDWRATRAIHSVYAFEGIDGNRVNLTLVSERHTDAAGNEVGAAAIGQPFWLLGMGTLGFMALCVLGIVVYRRSRSPAG